MQDDTSIYINASTPGFTTAQIHPGGPIFNVIFDKPFAVDSDRPGIVCAESDAAAIQSRDTRLVINDKTYIVKGHVFLDGMGLATVPLQET